MTKRMRMVGFEMRMSAKRRAEKDSVRWFHPKSSFLSLRFFAFMILVASNFLGACNDLTSSTDHHTARMPWSSNRWPISCLCAMKVKMRLRGGGASKEKKILNKKSSRKKKDINSKPAISQDSEMYQWMHDQSLSQGDSDSLVPRNDQDKTRPIPDQYALDDEPDIDEERDREIELEEDDAIRDYRGTISAFTPSLETNMTFEGLFEASNTVELPSHCHLTLEQFRAERLSMDVDGNPLPPKRVHLKGHENVFLDDFPIERIPTKERLVYKWRDRIVSFQ